MSKKITYFGEPIEAYDKSENVKKFFEGLKSIINNRNLNKSGKENAIQELFKTQFTPIQNDIKKKLQRLIYENQLQRTNIENKNVNAEMLQIAQSLNAYSNNLLNFYGNSYFEMTNSGERKKFIRDLRFLLSTFGMVQQALGNVVYGENRLSESNIRNAVSNKSKLVQAYEKKDREEKPLMKPSNGSASGTIIPKEQIPETNKSKLLSNQFLESNLLNNANNCYRNSVIHILYTLLSKEGSIEAAFASLSDPYMEMKSNLKQFLINYVTNRKPSHLQGILNTYNPFISVISDYSKDKGFFVIDDYIFKLKNKNNGNYINNIQELYTYYPTLDTSIKSANDFYDAFRENLINNFTVEKGKNQAFRNDYYFDKIINSIYKSYGNAQMYLYDLLKDNVIFKADFLNKLNVTSASSLPTYMSTLYYNSNVNIPSLNTIVLDAQTTFSLAPVASKGSLPAPVNKYILISVGDMHHFNDYDFDKLYLINNYYYQLSDIVYASGGHYISVNMRNGIWYKYDDMAPSAIILDGNNFNLEASGFYPNIFLFINTEVSPSTKTAGGAKVKSKKVSKVKSKSKKVKKDSKVKKVKKVKKISKDKKVKSKK